MGEPYAESLPQRGHSDSEDSTIDESDEDESAPPVRLTLTVTLTRVVALVLIPNLAVVLALALRSDMSVRQFSLFGFPHPLVMCGNNLPL